MEIGVAVLIRAGNLGYFPKGFHGEVRGLADADGLLFVIGYFLDLGRNLAGKFEGNVGNAVLVAVNQVAGIDGQAPDGDGDANLD